MMGLLLSLIVAVAAFNIITSLGLMVMEAGRSGHSSDSGADTAANHDGLYGARASAGIIGAILGRRLAHCLPAS